MNRLISDDDSRKGRALLRNNKKSQIINVKHQQEESSGGEQQKEYVEQRQQKEPTDTQTIETYQHWTATRAEQHWVATGKHPNSPTSDEKKVLIEYMRPYTLVIIIGLKHFRLQFGLNELLLLAGRIVACDTKVRRCFWWMVNMN